MLLLSQFDTSLLILLGEMEAGKLAVDDGNMLGAIVALVDCKYGAGHGWGGGGGGG